MTEWARSAGQAIRPDVRPIFVRLESLTYVATRGAWLAAALAVAALAVAGCGKKAADYGSVSGRVTFKGQPVSEGQVVFFEPEVRVYQTARIRPDGTYSVKMSDGPGLVTGSYQVAVMPPVVEGPGSKSAGPRSPGKYPDIPPRYRTPKTSQLSLTVVEGKNPPFDIDMKP
jgi:hypothetical protein